jgi:hypothetical protein
MRKLAAAIAVLLAASLARAGDPYCRGDKRLEALTLTLRIDRPFLPPLMETLRYDSCVSERPECGHPGAEARLFKGSGSLVVWVVTEDDSNASFVSLHDLASKGPTSFLGTFGEIPNSALLSGTEKSLNLKSGAAKLTSAP